VRDGTVLHFEIQADDVERAKAFHVQAFGWLLQRTLAAIPRSGEQKPVYCVEMGRINPFGCT
jgi:predicted enzyme related to lactoylglutathione lyase